MPSFDVVSEVDQHELANAIDQSNREVTTRFDFKGTDASFEYSEKDKLIKLTAQTDFQLQQMLDIVRSKLTKRGIDISCIEEKTPELIGQQAKQNLIVRQGIDSPLAKKIVQIVKNSKTKVQAAIQGEQVRISGKNRDDLQDIMKVLRAEKLDLPLQFNNFRD